MYKDAFSLIKVPLFSHKLSVNPCVICEPLCPPLFYVAACRADGFCAELPGGVSGPDSAGERGAHKGTGSHLFQPQGSLVTFLC